MVIIKYTLSLPINFTGIIHDEDFKMFKKNNLAHRYYGPSVLHCNGYKGWWFNNENFGGSYKIYNQKQFLKDINRQWL